MSPEELAVRKKRARTEPLIVAKAERGFRVYSAENRERIYEVAGTENHPTCTCPDFVHHARDPEWRCKHILAAFRRTEADGGDESAPGCEANRACQMLIKRSVSPDGRIDSLSVEFATPIDIGNGDAERSARRMLTLQEEIVAGFLNGNGDRPTGQRDPTPGLAERSDHGQPDQMSSGALAARLLRVERMETKRGTTLSLAIAAEGRLYRVFGDRERLGKALVQAGYAHLAPRIEDGLELDLPCRITTKPSKRGQYRNVDQLLPPTTPKQRVH